jgi:hypothetical protein
MVPLLFSLRLMPMTFTKERVHEYVFVSPTAAKTAAEVV